MSAFQDHLIAAVAAAGVLLTTTNLQHQRAHEVIHQTRLQGGQAALDGFADVLAQDVRSMGSGVPTGEPMVLATEAASVTFQGTTDSTDTARTVEYAWTTEVGDDGAEVVRVRRLVDGMLTGESPALSSFDLDLRDASGADPSALADTRRVHVRAELALPTDEIGTSAHVRRL